MRGNYSGQPLRGRPSTYPRLEALEGRWCLSVSGSLDSDVLTILADPDGGAVQVTAVGGEPTGGSGGRPQAFDLREVGDIRLRLDGDDAARPSKDGTITIKGKDIVIHAHPTRGGQAGDVAVESIEIAHEGFA